MKKLASLSLAVTALVALTLAAPAGSTGLDARVREFTPRSVESHFFPVETASGKPAGAAEWRVVAGTGNCCENFIGTTRDGKVLDFGGSLLHFSEDLGETWKEVVPLTPVVSGEGTVVDALGGDIIGATWSPYSGDRVVAFKYEAATGKWLHTENVLHTPFYDRPWIATVKGPFTIGATTVPYISILTSNLTKDVQYYSIDGLNYVLAQHSFTGQAAARESKWLDLPADPDADWTQPVTELGLGPLAGGGALAHAGTISYVPWSLLQAPDMKWSGYTFPDGALPDGRVLTDSRGWLHHVDAFPGVKSFTYMVSPSGGRGWAGVDIDLPGSLQVEDWDFKANAALGKAVVGVHAHDAIRNVDQDLVFELSIDGDVQVERVFYVGAGDIAVGTGLGASLRFDFSTIGLLPDGRIVTTFMDTGHLEPSLAILLDASAEGFSGDLDAPVIAALAARPNPFTPNGDGRDDRTRLTFRLDGESEVWVVVKKGDRVVRTLADGSSLRRGRHADWWDGLDDGGLRVPAGKYVLQVVAVDAAGNEGVASTSVAVRR
ncbi:MAG: hypothetical protein M3273_00680 [Actinomycetota bacterium]|nr:hypothetical protein [Actinomycetota bacterium]